MLNKTFVERKEVIDGLQQQGQTLGPAYESTIKLITSRFFYVSLRQDVILKLKKGQNPEWEFLKFLREKFEFDFVLPGNTFSLFKDFSLDKVKSLLQNELFKKIKIKANSIDKEEAKENLKEDVYDFLIEKFPLDEQ